MPRSSAEKKQAAAAAQAPAPETQTQPPEASAPAAPPATKTTKPKANPFKEVRKAVHPVRSPRAFDVDEVRQPKPRILRSAGPANKALDHHVIETTDRPVDAEWAKQMQINEEKVEIMVHETDDKTAASVPDIYINGIPQRFIRGKRIVVKRKYVELLARTRKTTYTQEEIVENNIRSIKNIAHTSLVYPFAVFKDTAPHAKEWLDRITNQE